jgi:hypothetical protein
VADVDAAATDGGTSSMHDASGDRDAGAATERDSGASAIDGGLRPGGPCAAAGIISLCLENGHYQCGVLPDAPEGTLELIQDCDWLGGRCEEDGSGARCVGGGYEPCELASSRPACFDETTLRSCNGIHGTGTPCGEGYVCETDHCEAAP